MRAALIFTATTVLGVTIAVAQQPQGPARKPLPPATLITPTPGTPQPNQGERGTPQQPSNAETRGTEDRPVVVKVLPSERSQEDIQQGKEKAEQDRQLTRFTGDLAFYTACLFGATVVLAIVSAGLALVAFFQMREARQSIKATVRLANAAAEQAGHAERAIGVTEQSSERQLRAYVWANATELHNLQVNGLPHVVIEVRNAGRTPAYDVEIAAGCLALNYPLEPNTNFPTIRRITATKMVLHPGSEPPFHAIAPVNMNLPTGLNEVQVEGLLRGNRMRLFAFCLITYKDAFDKQRETQLCVSVDASDALRGEAKYHVSFEHADQHNTAT
jgi:hypothetical protein